MWNVLENVHSWKKVYFPASVTYIMERAFMGCASLSDVHLVEGLQVIEEGAFADCVSLAAIQIPSTVESVAYEAFSNCQSLICIEISSSSSVELCDGALVGCQSLVNICLPKTNKDEKYSYLESWRFHGCPLLQQQYDCWLLGRMVKARFNVHPIHFKCYHASETTAEELRLAIQSSFGTRKDEDESDLLLMDSFGMTPFHVLLASAKARMDLLLVLL
ncbi:unnamed protein product [Cylindrotheca closterium]|uniref:Uncharacterized protein n=1 Tax=Cylindrotheca closterium TaxID=2856 RepID=A0AAD2G8H5_9STRA|nr:unnamed protein product [Cylindrotheca closterium]